MKGSSLSIFIDGASRGNPGESAIGMVAVDGKGREVFRSGKRIGAGTNNSAEYAAFIEALRFLDRRGRKRKTALRATIYTDSELLVRQLEGRYKVRSPRLAELHARAVAMLEANPHVRVEHVRRERNRVADWIVNRVLDEKPYRPADRSREAAEKTSEESPGS